MKRAAVLAFLLSSTALAQGRPVRLPPLPTRTPDLVAAGDLGSRFGLSAASKLLTSPDADERLRGVDRLGAIATKEAAEALVRAMDPGSLLVRDPRARLLAIRALAPHAGDEGPRGVLLRSMSEALPPARAPVADLIGTTAALALARHGGVRGAEVLAAVVRQGGRLGDVAADALLAHPPESIEALAGSKAPLSIDVARLLGALGDLRALPWLRAAVRVEEPRLREAALVSLARLGDQEATVIARQAARSPDPRANFAAARALSYVAPDEARSVVAALLTRDETRREALSVAEELGGAALDAALVSSATAGTLEDRRRAVMALGLGQTDAGATTLAGLLADADLSPSVILSLGLARGASAGRALTSAATDDTRRTAAFRASLVRALALGADVPADDGKLPAALRAFGAAVARGDRPNDEVLLGSPDVASAVALGLSARGPAALAAIDGVFVRAEGPVEQALGVVLLGNTDAPTRKLWALVDSRGAAAPLAALALGARDEPDSRTRLDALLRGTDPVMRAHVIMGLAKAEGGDREGRIAALYGFETDRRVRLAIVRALVRGTSPQARAVRALARVLDPDPDVRAVAGIALRAPRVGHDMVTVVGAVPLTALRVERPDGVVVPAITGPDGIALVPRVSVGVGRASFARPSP